MDTNALDVGRRRAPDERPQQIVDAALAVFGERGLAGARLDDIAQRAGIAKGTIYLYFPNKEELFREVVSRTIVARLDLAERELADGGERGPEAQLRTFMRTWWEFVRTPEFLTVYRLVVGELHRFPDLATFYVREVAGRAFRIVGRVIARGVEQGVFRPVDPESTTRMVVSLIITQAIWTQKAIAAARNPDEVRDDVCAFVFSALRPEAACAEGGR
ncbi:TetR/AcrR family transcriptional regulator [Roseisolibacter sp. H3M3-2]|uniref:TetR/AcrR family transcriptional regulator n=1 Tax=Roseisolibacter sp. H3M3-2 TaxID=3031323 RepID=UPI0023DC838A|nr:TetR/AcrR family transcriptional regulator [Roseisolibacter sp. H3M3-2]MDF1504278.1 TetR/AcrR family transcriptional regulator [Roseisolibacter sp. H3M3-2]